MAEHMPESVEREPKPGEGIKPERQPNRVESSSESVGAVPNIDKLRSQIESEAKTSKEVTVGEKEESKSDQPTTVNRELKYGAYASSLKTIRAKLSGPERLASKVVHQPVMERLSNVSAQTLARPSGILGGAGCALVGSLALLMFAKHFGISYNYLAVFLLYAGGFVIGLLIELAFNLVRPRNHRS